MGVSAGLSLLETLRRHWNPLSLRHRGGQGRVHPLHCRFLSGVQDRAACLGAVFHLLTWRLFGLSVLATALALGAFWLGLKTQDRVDQVTVNRVVLGLLGVLGIWLVIRAVG